MAYWDTARMIRHPWFPQMTNKRRLPLDQDEPNSDYSLYGAMPKDPITGSLKRRKIAALENGFHHLTLESNHQHRSFQPYPRPHNPTASIFAVPPSTRSQTITNPAPLIFPPHVEPPSRVTNSDVPDVKMKTSTWYEPEKDRTLFHRGCSLEDNLNSSTGIVVTSLEDSEDEDEDEVPCSLEVSPVFLDHLKKDSAGLPLVPPIPKKEDDMALVLYRPVILPLNQQENNDLRSTIEQLPASTLAEPDEFAMDVEL